MKISKILFSLLVSVSLICSCNNNKVPESLFEAGKGPWLNEIANDVYLVEDNNNGGNVCFIVGKREVLVVDAGTFPSASRAVTEMISQVTDKDIGYVVFTHCHSDHVAGVAGYPEGIRIIAHENLPANLDTFVRPQYAGFSEMLQEVGEDSLRVMYGNRFDDLVATVIRDPDILFGDTYTVDLGNYHVDLHYEGQCHTSDNITVLFREHGVLHTGDLVFNGSHPFVGKLYGADPARWMEVVRSWAGKDLTAVIPGHGKSGGKELLSAQADYFEKLIAAVRRYEGSTLSDVEIAREINSSDFPELEFSNYFASAIEVLRTK